MDEENKPLEQLLPPWMQRVDDDRVRVPEAHLSDLLFWCYDWDVRPVVNHLLVLENEPDQRSNPCKDVDVYIGVPELDDAGNETIWYTFFSHTVDTYLELEDRNPEDNEDLEADDED
jgi:hypothetical protein